MSHVHSRNNSMLCRVYSPRVSREKGVVKEGSKGNRKFFHLTCHYVADCRGYLNLLTGVTSPVQHIPSTPCSLHSQNTISKLLTCELMSHTPFCCCWVYCCGVFSQTQPGNEHKGKLAGKGTGDGGKPLLMVMGSCRKDIRLR